MNERLFATNTNKQLAEAVAQQTGLLLTDCTVARYADQEVEIRIPEQVVTDIHKKSIYVLGSTFPPAENILELETLIHTLKINGAGHITAIVPYWGYAKSDRMKTVGTARSAELRASTLVAAGADKMITVDIHSPMATEFFRIPILNIHACSTLASHFKDPQFENLAVVAPDLGSVEQASEFAAQINIPKDQVVKLTKTRPGKDQAQITGFIGDVQGKNAIIVDDMIQSGGTIISAAEALKAKGANQVYVAVTHLIATGPSIQRFQDHPDITAVVISDTIPFPQNTNTSKFSVVSIATPLADAISQQS